MNERFLKTIIRKVQDEQCPTHGEKATFKISGQIIVISDTCCSNFYQVISEKIQNCFDQAMLKF